MVFAGGFVQVWYDMCKAVNLETDSVFIVTSTRKRYSLKYSGFISVINYKPTITSIRVYVAR